MSRESDIICITLQDAIYFIKKNELEKAVITIQSLIKRYSPKDNDPA